MFKAKVWSFCCALLLSQSLGFAQQQPAGNQQAGAGQPPTVQQVRPDYILGPNDQILIHSNAEEISDRPYRVDQDGYINLPLVNRVPASGITIAELERDLIARLKMYLNAPEVSITVSGFRNEPVSFFGAFTKPGIYPLTGGRTLVEMLTVAGGLLPNASRHLRVTRRAENGTIPLPNAIVDPSSGVSSAEIDITNLAQELNPAEDIELKAGDRVIAEQSQPIYVGGEVSKSAPIELGSRESYTVMQALSQSGFTATSKRKQVIVLRPVEGTGKLARIDVNIKRIINGEDNDFPLYPNDILYVERQPQILTNLPNATTGLFTSLPYLLIYTLLR